MKSRIAMATWLLAASMTGCQTPPGEIVQGQLKLAGTDSAAYLDRIAAEPTVSEAQAVRGILLLLGQEREMTFAQAVKELQQRKILPRRWRFSPERPITKGKTAYMVYQACGVRGGLTLTLIGPTQRYCLKELQYRGVMSSGVPYNTVTGMEFVAVLTRADELRQTGKVSELMRLEGEMGEQQ